MPVHAPLLADWNSKSKKNFPCWSPVLQIKCNIYLHRSSSTSLQMHLKNQLNTVLVSVLS